MWSCTAPEQFVKRIFDRSLRQRGKNTLGLIHILAPHRFTQFRSIEILPRPVARLDRMQNFFFTPAAFLDSIRVAVKNLENRQGLQRLGKLSGHVQCGRQRHHRVEPNVVFAAKSAGIGKRRSRHQPPQFNPRTQLRREDRQQAIDWRLLH